MFAGGARRARAPMNERDGSLLQTATDRFERRLAEETGKVRVDMANGFADQRAEMTAGFGELRAEMAAGFGELRAEMARGFGEIRTELANGLGGLRGEMIDRDHALLKWVLVFWATQIAAIAALLALFR